MHDVTDESRKRFCDVTVPGPRLRRRDHLPFGIQQFGLGQITGGLCISGIGREQQRASLDNATVTVRLAGLPETTFRVDHHGEDIQIGGGLPVTGPQKLKISELQAVLEPGTAPVASASSLDLEFTSAGEKVSVSGPIMCRAILDDGSLGRRFVGPSQGSKAREVLMTVEELEQSLTSEPAGV